MDQEILQDPVAAYDRIAPVFARLAESRKPYLDSIDRLVIAEIPEGSRSLLDVGAGDGSRSRRIARARNIEDLVLLEPSVAMQGRQQDDAKVWNCRAESLASVQAEFDVIACLWNVLGHIFPAASRAEVLRQFARLISPQGRIFLDVHHRYNARHYGVLPTALRYVADRFSSNETNGDVEIAWDVKGIHCATKGHVFTHREVQGLCRSAGLVIEKQFIVDYASGKQRRWSFAGHLLYVLRTARQHPPSLPAAARTPR